MKVLRTPDENFEDLKDYPFPPCYTFIKASDGTELRIHHIDEGPEDGPLVLCMHGQPVWSYLYRKMVPFLTQAGCRVVAPDLVGYGKSDKPASREDYSYENQVRWMGAWLEANDLRNITFFGQDWGGLTGLRLVVNHPDRFDRVVISNTGLPYNPDMPEALVKEIEHFWEHGPRVTLASMHRAVGAMRDGGHPATKFAYWQKFCWETEDIPVGFMMSMAMEQHSVPARLSRMLLHGLGAHSPLATPLAKAYDAPFPDPSYKMAIRAMPSHVPTLPTSPSLDEQRKAWEFLETFDKPFLCAFSDSDPVTQGGQEEFLAKVPGTKGLPHTTVKGGHFIQEAAPEILSNIIINLIKST